MKKIVFLLILLVFISILTSCTIRFGFEPVKLNRSSPIYPNTVIESPYPSLLPNESPKPSMPLSAQIEEVLLWEQDGIEIYASSIIYGDYFGPQLKITIINNSAYYINVYDYDVSVNDYMTSYTYFNVKVLSGKKAVGYIDIYDSFLSTANIEYISKIELKFEVSKYNEEYIYESNPEMIFVTDAITIKTNYYGLFEQPKFNATNLIFDENNIRIFAEEFYFDSMYSYLNLYIENNSSDKIVVRQKNASINNYMITGYLESAVVPGKMAIEALSFSTSDLENTGIDKIEHIELVFRIYNYTDESTYESETILINFEN